MTYTIQIVTQNSDPYLNDVLEHCWTLTIPPTSVIIVDNASTDDTLPIIYRHQKNHPTTLTLLRNVSNVGFSKGHNQAFALSRRKGVEAAFVLNPDVLLEPDSTERLITVLTNRTDCGSTTGKLLRMGEASGQHQRIDSAGLAITRSLRVIDRGAGELERGQYDMLVEVFGGSGAATLYRLKALDDAQQGGMDFDEKFFAYKEDIDLAFRLRWRGWKCWYHPEVVGYHARTHRGGTLREILTQRKYRSVRTRQYSYRNHFWMLLKNVPVSILARQFAWILMVEVGHIVYFSVTEPRTLFALSAVLRGLPRIAKERQSIFSSAVGSNKSFIQWMNFTI